MVKSKAALDVNAEQLQRHATRLRAVTWSLLIEGATMLANIGLTLVELLKE